MRETITIGNLTIDSAYLETAVDHISKKDSPTGNEIALLRAAERIQEPESALKAVHTDLLLRGEKDSDGGTVVGVGFGVWIKVCDALEPKNNQAPHIQE